MHHCYSLQLVISLVRLFARYSYVSTVARDLLLLRAKILQYLVQDGLTRLRTTPDKSCDLKPSLIPEPSPRSIQPRTIDSRSTKLISYTGANRRIPQELFLFLKTFASIEHAQHHHHDYTVVSASESAQPGHNQIFPILVTHDIYLSIQRS